MTTTPDPLVARLRELQLSGPDPRLVTARVLAAARKPDRSFQLFRPALAAIAALVVLPLAWSILYFAPATGAAMADAPALGQGTAEVLNQVGLGNTTSVTAQDSTAAAAGHQIKLLGAYADPIRTIVLLRISPAGGSSFQGVTMSDQFGRSYELRSGYSDARTGEEALVFEPLSGPASSVGARLDINLTVVEGEGGSKAVGRWEIKGTVLPRGGRRLSAPAAGTLGPGMVTFDKPQLSGDALEVTASVRGISSQQLNAVQPGPAKAQAALKVQLLNAAGTEVRTDVSWGFERDAGHLDVLAVGVTPGTYRLLIQLDGAGTLERTLEVPRS